MGNSYWVRAGQLLAGEYRGARDGDDARRRVRAMLDGGVTYFIDLTEPHELAPYDVVLAQEAARRGIATIHTRHPIRDAGVPRRAEQMDPVHPSPHPDNPVHSPRPCDGGVTRRGWRRDDRQDHLGPEPDASGWRDQ